MLSKKQRDWLRHVLAGESDVVAYELAYGCTRSSALANAYRLRENDGLMMELRRLKKAAQESLDRQLILSRVEKMAYLSAAIRTPIGEIDETSPLASSVYKNGDLLHVEKIDPLGAIRELNKMASYYDDATVLPDTQAEVGALLSQMRRSTS